MSNKQLDSEACQAFVGSSGNKVMFSRLGSVVRELHDTLRQLGYEIVSNEVLREISGSQGRLEYIALLTEQSANKVLNAVDEALPIQSGQLKKAKELEAQWTRMLAGKLSPSEIEILALSSRDFAANVAQSSEETKTHLMEIMMAQAFQDITGQIITKIAALTQKLEIELAQILQDYVAESTTKKSINLLAGPAEPKLAMEQNDVDSLLSDLGF